LNLVVEVLAALTPGLAHRATAPLVSKSALLIAGKRPAEAIPLLERALALKPPPMFAKKQPYGRFLLGRALLESGGDCARGRTEMQRGRTELAALHDTEHLAEADAFLARTK
jgi:hypothetical protein